VRHRRRRHDHEKHRRRRRVLGSWDGADRGEELGAQELLKLCLHCGSRVDADDWRCASCGQSPQRNEFWNFAPEIDAPDDFFEATGFEDLARLEERSFWFRARNHLILWALQKYAPDTRSFLEVGCGTGYVLSGIQREFPNVTLTGAELHEAGLHFARERLAQATLIQMDARRIPFESEFDAIGAFDVLEHVPEDSVALTQMFRALKPGGKVLITVPQHAWLWSTADDYAHHRRRYTRREMRAKLESAGFHIVTVTSFVALLLPVLLASRLRQRGPVDTFDPITELRMGRRLDRALEKFMNAERWLIRRSVRFPVGGSLLVVAEKPSAG
jgi:SAM-dependent methyltransferase